MLAGMQLAPLLGTLSGPTGSWLLPAAQASLPALAARLAAVARQQLVTRPPSNTFSTTTTSSSSQQSSSGKGDIPHAGPLRERLRALPFSVPPAAARNAFEAYHLQQHPASSGSTATALMQRKPWLTWMYSRQRPALRKPLKEAFLPFWVGEARVEVSLHTAEVGTRRLVTRYNKRTGRYEPDWETQWTRVRTDLTWATHHTPEDPAMQLYGAWKYTRSDIEAMRPGAAVTRAQRITPDLLQASPGAESDTRRVGPFVITPDAARKQLASVVRSAAHRDAEERLQRLTGAQLVRLVDLDIKYLSGGSGPLLSPVYVPVYIFSWMYGGSKVRTFVSGVNPAAVSGVQVLNDQAMAVTAAGVASSVLALTGLASGAALFWGGMVVPFVLGGLAARFWPRLHQAVSSVRTWWEQRQVGAAGGGGAAAGGAGGTGEGDSTVWDRDFVHAFQAQRAYERQQQQQAYGGGQQGFSGFSAEDFQEMLRDPFSWFERQFARQQQRQQQQQQQQYRSTGGQQQQQYQQRPGGGYSSSRAAPGAAAGDPLGYYSRLGVKPGATPQEVQAAFRGLALKHHPDRYADAAAKAEATKRFQGITEAYQVLRNPAKRQQYDAGIYRG